MSPLPDPDPLSLEERQARARALAAYDAQLIAVLEPEQHLPGLLDTLGRARQVLIDEARKHWPDQSWESTNRGGPPEPGDLHVKVSSVISSDEAEGRRDAFALPDGVALRIAISKILPAAEANDRNRTIFSSEAVLFVPLDLASSLVVALEEHLAYWRENPPLG